MEIDENAIQGCITLEEPYTIINDGYDFRLYCNDKFIGRGHFRKKEREALLLLLNDAYQRGYHKCSINLMNKK